jgi:peptide-methionine (S)-S-oxide reductase
MNTSSPYPTAPQQPAQATLAGGCFWCLEAALLRTPGVLTCEPGYCGGNSQKPTYEEVCTGQAGHAEVVQVQFDSAQLPFTKLLTVFFLMHDPTSLNRQGHDIGSQYRSAIFYHDETQRDEAQAFLTQLQAQGVYSQPIVTTLEPLHNYCTAENQHHRYFDTYPNQPYCMRVIAPKLHVLQAQGEIQDVAIQPIRPT